MIRNDYRARNHPAYWAFVAHRVSGVLLTIFLPFHFWALSQAIEGEARLDSFLRWTEQPLVKAGEVILVLLLAWHTAGGLRLLMIEFFAWRDRRKTLVAVATAFTFAAGVAFLLNIV